MMNKMTNYLKIRSKRKKNESTKQMTKGPNNIICKTHLYLILVKIKKENMKNNEIKKSLKNLNFNDERF